MFVRSVRGVPIDVSGLVVRLDGHTTLNFGLLGEGSPIAGRDDLLAGARAYVHHLIGTLVPNTVRTSFFHIRTAFARSRAIQALVAGGPRVLGDVFDALADLDRGRAKDCVSDVRRFYRWCVDEDLPGFDADTAIAMDHIVVGSRQSGRAVLRMDPDEGPLSERQARALEDALWRAEETGLLPTKVVAAALLMLLLGPNPETLRQLEEDDVVEPRGNRPFLLRMPRIKKGIGRRRRDAFRDRELTPRLGRLLVALVEENRRLAPQKDDTDALYGRPLFRRSTPDARLRGTPHETDAARAAHDFFKRLVKGLPAELAAIDATVGALRLHPRRLRYTFATRAVRAGATPRQLMEMLDHSDVGYLMVYFNGRLDLCEDLNETIGSTLGVMADLFFGKASVKALFDTTAFALSASSDPIAPEACIGCGLFRPRPDATMLGAPIHDRGAGVPPTWFDSGRDGRPRGGVPGYASRGVGK